MRFCYEVDRKSNVGQLFWFGSSETPVEDKAKKVFNKIDAKFYLISQKCLFI